MPIEIHGSISRAVTIAVGSGIREYPRLVRVYGPGRWRRRMGVAQVQLETGRRVLAEVHWYEATGIGRREFKMKRLLGE